MGISSYAVCAISQIALYIEQLDSDHLDSPLKLDGRIGGDDPKYTDELDHVVRRLTVCALTYIVRGGACESEQDNRTFITCYLVGLALWRLDGSFVTINPAFARIIGYSVAEALRANYWDIVIEEP
ncbi:MAG: PAS domain-containing protein [Thiotrichaceae bacterium]